MQHHVELPDPLPERELRWLFAYRFGTLMAVALLLPAMVPASWPTLEWLPLAAIAFLVTSSVPLWLAGKHQDGKIAALLLTESLGINLVAWLTGGAGSPIMLLALPALTQAAQTLQTRKYAAIAIALLYGYVIVLLNDFALGAAPAWWPLWASALVVTATWLGVAGWLVRRNRKRAALARRAHARYRALVERLPALGGAHAPEEAERRFWGSFMGQIRQAGEFQSVAVVRWDGPRPEVVATDRAAAWGALVKRHANVFRAAARSGRAQTFLEPIQVAGSTPRGILAYPISGLVGGTVAALCVMDLRPRVRHAGETLERFLPLARLGLALSAPRLQLHRKPIAWQVIMNATLHRLQGKLARFLVLVHVDEGVIEADALLLADAIAHLIEEVLDRTPAQTPVRLTVRPADEGWRFRIETEHPPGNVVGSEPSPGMLLARQVVAAHGGTWEQIEQGGAAFQLGFVLPTEATRRPVGKA